MAPVVNFRFARINRPHHQMWSAPTNFVIATRTAICLDGSSSGNRSYFEFVTVWSSFDAGHSRQWPRPMPQT